MITCQFVHGCKGKVSHKILTKFDDYFVCSKHAKEAKKHKDVRYIVPLSTLRKKNPKKKRKKYEIMRWCPYCKKETLTDSYKDQYGYYYTCSECHNRTSNPIHPQAIESLKRYKEDLRAGHVTAAEYWRGQAGAYFTANPKSLRVDRRKESIKSVLRTYRSGDIVTPEQELSLLRRDFKEGALSESGYRIAVKEVLSRKNPILSGSRREKVVARKGKLKIVELIDFRFHRWFYLMTTSGVLIQRFKKFDQAHDALVKISVGRNPSFVDIAEKHFARRPSVAHLVGKVYKMPDGTLWQLVAYNDLNIPYFSKVVGSKVGKKQFTIAFWSPDMKPVRNPILSTLGTYMLGGVGLYAGIQAAKWGHEKIKERMVKNPLTPEGKKVMAARLKIRRGEHPGRISIKVKTLERVDANTLAKRLARELGVPVEYITAYCFPISGGGYGCVAHLKETRAEKWTYTRNPSKPHTEVVVSQLPKCNFCTKDARFDGKTRMGPWAYMCFAHYAQYGVGLGLGRGQRLILSKKNPPKEWHEKHYKQAYSKLIAEFDKADQFTRGQLTGHATEAKDALNYYSENPIPKHCTPKQFGSETYYYAGKTMFRDKLDRAISDLKRLGVKSKHSPQSRSYGYMLWTSQPTAVHFEMM